MVEDRIVLLWLLPLRAAQKITVSSPKLATPKTPDQEGAYLVLVSVSFADLSTKPATEAEVRLRLRVSACARPQLKTCENDSKISNIYQQ